MLEETKKPSFKIVDSFPSLFLRIADTIELDHSPKFLINNIAINSLPLMFSLKNFECFIVLLDSIKENSFLT